MKVPPRIFRSAAVDSHARARETPVYTPVASLRAVRWMWLALIVVAAAAALLVMCSPLGQALEMR